MKTKIRVFGETMDHRANGEVTIHEQQQYDFDVETIVTFWEKDNKLTIESEGKYSTEFNHFPNWEKYVTIMNGVQIGIIKNKNHKI